MVYNSTDINKTNNHLSTKESLNSDGQQLHRYQQNEQSPLVMKLKTTTTFLCLSQAMT
jgi:hypothetical protein